MGLKKKGQNSKFRGVGVWVKPDTSGRDSECVVTLVATVGVLRVQSR